VKKIRMALLCLGLTLGASTAEAIPVLQLDLAGGVYDVVTETIVAPGGEFTLYAVLTPKTGATQAQINALLAETYYVSVALSPQTNAGGDYGSFTFGSENGSFQMTKSPDLTPITSTTVQVTEDMEYGVPPLETFLTLQGHDSGDLAKHGVYPTYFAEFGFQFLSTNTATAYNAQDSPGGLTPSGSGQAFYAAFTGNSSLLSDGYTLHFDLYDTQVRNCGKQGFPGCEDIDIDRFAPFSHDASLGPPDENVPEPSSLLLLITGMAFVVRRRFA
jgi:hypothetical protein